MLGGSSAPAPGVSTNDKFLTHTHTHSQSPAPEVATEESIRFPARYCTWRLLRVPQPFLYSPPSPCLPYFI